VRYYEDLIEGERRSSGTRTVSEDELVAFARQYDPQWFHTDREAARGSAFGGLIASGIFTMALWRQLDHEIAHDIAWICGVAWDEVRFPAAVRPGDTLRAHATCLAKRPSAKQPDRGVVTYQYVLENQRGETVFSCRSTNLIRCRTPAASSAP